MIRRAPDWWVKIGDFGTSKRVRGEQTAFHTSISSIFSAPEMLGIVQGGSDGTYTTAVDMWSLGCLIHWLLTYAAPLPPGLLYAYVHGMKPLPTDTMDRMGLSEDVQTLVKQLLDPLPQNRLTTSQAASHPWLRTAEDDHQPSTEESSSDNNSSFSSEVEGPDEDIPILAAVDGDTPSAGPQLSELEVVSRHTSNAIPNLPADGPQPVAKHSMGPRRGRGSVTVVPSAREQPTTTPTLAPRRGPSSVTIIPSGDQNSSSKSTTEYPAISQPKEPLIVPYSGENPEGAHFDAESWASRFRDFGCDSSSDDVGTKGEQIPPCVSMLRIERKALTSNATQGRTTVLSPAVIQRLAQLSNTPQTQSTDKLASTPSPPFEVKRRPSKPDFDSYKTGRRHAKSIEKDLGRSGLTKPLPDIQAPESGCSKHTDMSATTWASAFGPSTSRNAERTLKGSIFNAENWHTPTDRDMPELSKSSSQAEPLLVTRQYYSDLRASRHSQRSDDMGVHERGQADYQHFRGAGQLHQSPCSSNLEFVAHSKMTQ